MSRNGDFQTKDTKSKRSNSSGFITIALNSVRALISYIKSSALSIILKMQTHLFYIYNFVRGKSLWEMEQLNNSMHIQATLLLNLVFRGLSCNKDYGERRLI